MKKRHEIPFLPGDADFTAAGGWYQVRHSEDGALRIYREAEDDVVRFPAAALRPLTFTLMAILRDLPATQQARERLLTPVDAVTRILEEDYADYRATIVEVHPDDPS